MLAAESGSHAGAKAAANNNDWLNVGYTDSGTYGSTDSVWSDPITAADTTAGWLHGQAAIAGYGTATAAIHAILTTAGQPADAQITAIQASGWASSGYPDLPARYADVTAGGGGAVPMSLDLGPSAACAASTGETLTPGAVASILPDGQATIPQGAPAAEQAALAAGNRIGSEPYSYGGGHCPAAMVDPPGPDACPDEQENGAPGYDCSSATSFVLWGAGLGQILLGQTGRRVGGPGERREPGPGQWVTIDASGPHAFIDVAGIVLDTAYWGPWRPLCRRRALGGSPPRSSRRSCTTATPGSCDTRGPVMRGPLAFPPRRPAHTPDSDTPMSKTPEVESPPLRRRGGGRRIRAAAIAAEGGQAA